MNQMKTLQLNTTMTDMKNAFNRDTGSLHIAKKRNKEKLKCRGKKTDHPFLGARMSLY